MSRVAVLDDHQTVLKALAKPLEDAGHETLLELAPLNFERIAEFSPEVIIVGLARKAEAQNRPIDDVTEDVLGYKALVDLRDYPALNAIPTIVVGIGLLERDVPIEAHYDLFLAFPEDMDLFERKVGELAKVKKKREISAYICPNPACSSRLLFMKRPIKDLFCPKCGTAVAFVDEEKCIWLGPDGHHYPCAIKDLLASGARE